MATSVFISHAGTDLAVTRQVADTIEGAGLVVVLDRNDDSVGRNVIGFMEYALGNSNYCLLLWSGAASESNWVRAEWQAAFHKSVETSQNFLLLARLESVPVPQLLRPRLFVDLFPEVRSGMEQLLATFKNDEVAAVESKRPVAPPLADLSGPGEETVYVSSKTFSKTFPVLTSLSSPVAMLLERVVKRLNLPAEFGIQGEIGCRFLYDLVAADQVLDPARDLYSQGVRPQQLLWLQVEMTPFSRAEPLQRRTNSSIHRGRSSGLEAAAARYLRSRLATVGL